GRGGLEGLPFLHRKFLSTHFSHPEFYNSRNQVKWHWGVKWELHGTFSGFVSSKVFFESLLAHRGRIKSDVVFVSREINKVSSMQVKSRHAIADCLLRFWCRGLHGFPHLFQHFSYI